MSCVSWKHLLLLMKTGGCSFFFLQLFYRHEMAGEKLIIWSERTGSGSTPGMSYPKPIHHVHAQAAWCFTPVESCIELQSRLWAAVVSYVQEQCVCHHGWYFTLFPLSLTIITQHGNDHQNMCKKKNIQCILHCAPVAQTELSKPPGTHACADHCFWLNRRPQPTFYATTVLKVMLTFWTFQVSEQLFSLTF